MATSAQSRVRVHPASEEELHLVRNELTDLLKSEHFSNSKRYPALLAYIVEKTLAGHADELKERTVGIEVFHRPADYDTNNDTVVRVAAGEVRRRLALIYLESDIEHPIQISLPTGSYVPEFYRPASQDALAPRISADLTLARRIARTEFEALNPSSVAAPPRATWRKRSAVLAMLVLTVSAGALFVRLRAARPTSVDLFWQPVHVSTGPAIICPGAVVLRTSGLKIAGRTDDYPYTSMATTVSVAELVKLFAKNQIEYVIQPTSVTTLADMREHPLILIGAYTNEWTSRLQDDLRYRFSPDPGRQIYDGQDPSRIWERPSSLPISQEDDYAVIGRFHSKVTQSLVILIAGIGKNGTEAAAQFVTSRRYLDLLDQGQSKDWASKNVEVVLKTKVIDGKTGAPTIETVYVW